MRFHVIRPGCLTNVLTNTRHIIDSHAAECGPRTNGLMSTPWPRAVHEHSSSALEAEVRSRTRSSASVAEDAAMDQDGASAPQGSWPTWSTPTAIPGDHQGSVLPSGPCRPIYPLSAAVGSRLTIPCRGSTPLCALTLQLLPYLSKACLLGDSQPTIVPVCGCCNTDGAPTYCQRSAL